jgi:hypothetical protein
MYAQYNFSIFTVNFAHFKYTFCTMFKQPDTYVKSVKGKAIPLQAWRGPEGSRRLRLPDFKTISI